MGEKIQSFFTRLLAAAALFALAMWLLRLGVCYLSHIWWVLLILAVLIVAGIVIWKTWRKWHGGW